MHLTFSPKTFSIKEIRFFTHAVNVVELWNNKKLSTPPPPHPPVLHQPPFSIFTGLSLDSSKKIATPHVTQFLEVQPSP